MWLMSSILHQELMFSTQNLNMYQTYSTICKHTKGDEEWCHCFHSVASRNRSHICQWCFCKMVFFFAENPSKNPEPKMPTPTL